MKPAIHFLFLLAIALLGVSCSATNRLSMTVTEPAEVALPGSVKRVGIINRSVPSEGNRGLAKIDAILSAEGVRLDSLGAEEAVAGLADRLRLSNRYEAVVILHNASGVARGLRGMPASLNREQIQELCQANGLDAIFSLSFYDTDTQVYLQLGMMELPNELGIPISVPAHKLDLDTEVRNGWRIYLPELPLPVDEWVYRDHFRVSGKGVSPVAALESIAFRKDRVLELSRQTGHSHGGRLEPRRIRVGRDYFVRGSDLFARGRRLAQTGDWDGAASLWEQEINHPKDKVAGRAFYNMAIINEINGDLDAAIDWARKSYADFGTRHALDYLRTLERRRAAQEQLMADAHWQK
ncbi:DUF6340 family protein [Robiginitalea sp. SC105]|uniref:DUF6340 family protein n=1 Tax=Robiginitalea sp. SC105 TaxID=2762332 RepID=UPI001639D8C5|nr:DUF6340 family protein [Robiginitalea sp. SC105]MBC2840381.1 tetratricopeptide repeat protein [Robiginitalea sp. SC105]